MLGFLFLIASGALLAGGAELFAEHAAAAGRRLGVTTLAIGLILAGGRAALKRVRESDDPDAVAARERGKERARAQMLRARDWERRFGPPDWDRYQVEIQPVLDGLSAAGIARITGVSISHASQAKSQRKRLHAVHWDLSWRLLVPGARADGAFAPYLRRGDAIQQATVTYGSRSSPSLPAVATSSSSWVVVNNLVLVRSTGLLTRRGKREGFPDGR